MFSIYHNGKHCENIYFLSISNLQLFSYTCMMYFRNIVEFLRKTFYFDRIMGTFHGLHNIVYISIMYVVE